MPYLSKEKISKLYQHLRPENWDSLKFSNTMRKFGVTFPTLHFRSEDFRVEKLQGMQGCVLKH